MTTVDETKIIEAADRIAREVVAPAAPAIDRNAAFPEAAIAAAREAGLLGPLPLGIAAQVVERVARECGSTAMVLCMHQSAAAVTARRAPERVQREVAAGKHLLTLAFSETGSRSQFWAPVGTARRAPGGVRLDAHKSFSTSARHATAYVWSSKPLEAEGASTLWLVPSGTPGLRVPQPFDGLGLRGNDSSPIVAEGVVVPEDSRLGADGAGFPAMLEMVLPTFNVLSAACSLGLAAAALERATAHVAGTRFQHSDSSIADLPTVRAYVARMRVQLDMAHTLWLDTIAALASGRADAVMRVLECKAAAGEVALEVTATAMRVCGGAAYRREVGVERQFRDAQAASVMGPTTDVLYDFIGKAACGMEVF
jgi:alkylation response protein AidB-like acyl-CoA dehydrogenase